MKKRKKDGKKDWKTKGRKECTYKIDKFEVGKKKQKEKKRTNQTRARTTDRP